MITLEDLEKTSLKHRLTIHRDGFKEKHGYYNYHIRNPDTVIGFLSIEKANEIVFGENPDMLGHHRLTMSAYGGLGDTRVTFLSDDCSYAWSQEQGWPIFVSCTVGIGVKSRPGIEGGIASCVEQLLYVYCIDEFVIDTREELLAYINDGVLPSRELLRFEEVTHGDVAMLAIETKNADGEWWRDGTHAHADAFKKYPFSKYVWTRFNK